MGTPVREKDVRLDFRVQPDIKDRIERAATVSGKTVTDFAVGTLTNAADDVLEHYHVTELSMRDRDIFLAVLDGKAEPNALLRKAAGTHKRLILK